MPRTEKHSKNWGGKRKGAGLKPGQGHGRGRRKGTVNRMTAKAIKMAEEADIHPLEFLLQVVADNEQSVKDRLAAAQASLPYVLSRKATEVNVTTNAHENQSNQDLLKQIEEFQRERKMLAPAIIEGEAVQVG